MVSVTKMGQAAGGSHTGAWSGSQSSVHLPKPQACEHALREKQTSLFTHSRGAWWRAGEAKFARLGTHGDLQRPMWSLSLGPLGSSEVTQRAVTPLAAPASQRCASSGLDDLAASVFLWSPLPSYPMASGLCLSPALENQAWESNLK